MKHYLIELTYLVPLEQLEPVLPAHRAFLQEGYDRGMLLCSGPQEPRKGGIVLARAETLGEIEAFLARDPYRIHGCASYRIVQFHAVKYQPWASAWFEEN